ncbi:MAG: hypothetical protein K2Q20_00345 [Phycisphaerales bacterium]|nr:hypothetical protein [Phycisphaerales bacterium]
MTKTPPTHRQPRRVAAVLALAGAMALGVSAASAGYPPPAPEIKWNVVAPGGGTSGDGVISLEGTIGQILVGPTLFSQQAGIGCPTNIAVSGGYWHPLTSAGCPADFNADGTRNVSDIFSFLSAWFATQGPADVNCSGGIAVDDIFAFLSLWFAGCP